MQHVVRIGGHSLQFSDHRQVTTFIQVYDALRRIDGASVAIALLPTLAQRYGAMVQVCDQEVSTMPTPEPPDWLSAYSHLDEVERYLQAFTPGGPSDAPVTTVLRLRVQMTEMLHELQTHSASTGTRSRVGSV